MSGVPSDEPPIEVIDDAPAAEPPTDDAPVEVKPSLIKRASESVRTRADAARVEIERRRVEVPVIDIALRGVEHDGRTGGGILAGAVAFRFFLFVVPYVFVVFMAFGFGADAANKSPTDLARSSGIVGLAASAIDFSTQVSTFARVVTFSVALWALLSASRTMVKALYAVHALIWGVPLHKPKRVTVQGVITILIATVLMVVIRLVDLMHETSIVLWAVAMVFLVGIPGLVWLWCTTNVFPSAPGTTWRDLLPGAVLFGIGVQLLHFLTIVWIAHSLESKSQTYGALGAALTILLWAFLLGRVVTASASLNTVIWRDKHPADVVSDAQSPAS